MILALISITIIYLVIIGRFVFGFDKVTHFELKDLEPKTAFSIIIPFRNEADNLPELLRSLSELHYPERLFEIILVDDDSSDESINVINTFLENASHDIKIIDNVRVSKSPKKDAITAAIKTSRYDWIITTDADCKCRNQWLTVLDSFIQEKQPKMVIGPVTYSLKNTFLERFQLLDFLSLIGATIGGFGIKKPFLCNGANLVYAKAAFKSVNGFKGNDDIASGDDIFLMEKMLKKHPNEVLYLKHQEAIINTKPQPSLSQLGAKKIWHIKL